MAESIFTIKHHLIAQLVKNLYCFSRYMLKDKLLVSKRGNLKKGNVGIGKSFFESMRVIWAILK